MSHPWGEATGNAVIAAALAWEEQESAVDPEFDGDLSDCPWFQRTIGNPDADPHGVCSYGCEDEPRCQTCIPSDGWPRQNLVVAVRAYRAATAVEHTQGPDMDAT